MLCLPSDYSDLKIHSLQLPVLILQQTILNPPLREEGHKVAEGVHVQLRQECSVGEKGPPGKKSEPRSLDSSGEGN